MKYIKITGKDVFWGKEEIKQRDLIDLKAGRVDVIINIEDCTFFNSEKNEWEKIPQD